MKKALPLVLVLAAITAAVIFYLKRGMGAMDLPAGFAAELAPADTILLVEAADLARTVDRWNSTSLHKIAMEPEWKEFTAKWDDFVANNEVARDTFGVFGEVLKAQPRALFLAVTSIEAAGPKFVGGFPYSGRKGDVENLVRQLKGQIVKTWPAAKSELSTYEGIEIETLKDPKFTAAMAYRDNWFFYANDTELLLKTLSRYLKKTDAGPSLAKEALWKAAEGAGAPEPDLRMWAKWEVFAEKLNALNAVAAGGSKPAVQATNPIQSITYTWKLDGPLMRDHVAIHTATPPKVEVYANRLLAFTNPATYAYWGVNFAGVDEHATETVEALKQTGFTTALEQKLEAKGLKLADFFAVFGTEFALMSAWEQGGIALPDFFGAIEVKDAARAKRFAEVFAEQMGNANPSPESVADTTIWAGDLGIPFLKPMMAVNSQHLIFAMNPASFAMGRKQLEANGPNLATQPGSPFPAALKTVVQPTAGLFYLDAKTLFERLYDKGKPMIAFSLVGKPAGKYFDAAKLPQAATISQHLAPIILSYGTSEKGWVIESTGSVGLIGTFVLGGPSALLGARSTQMAPPTAQKGADSVPPAPPSEKAAPRPLPLPEAGPSANPPKSVPIPQLNIRVMGR